LYSLVLCTFIRTCVFVLIILYFAFLSLLTTHNTKVHAESRNFLSPLRPSLFFSFYFPSLILLSLLSLLVSFVCTTHTTQTPTTPVGFEPVIPASDWPQTLALDRPATEIGSFEPRTAPRYSETLYRLSHPNCPHFISVLQFKWRDRF
jgi:hypothetical protein